MPYVRSWALNVGARLARGRLLVFHDGDMLAPARYAAELLAVHRSGYEVINLKRFIYYLGKEQTTATLRTGKPVLGGRLEAIVQNLQAGGSVAVDPQAFHALGGFDEGFRGWGGEDDEFWDRAGSRSVWPWGYLPILHLWHAPQPEKERRDRSTAERLRERSAIPAEARIRELAAHDFGVAAGPAGRLSGREANGT
jgi:GT2 family glycosyltransferase